MKLTPMASALISTWPGPGVGFGLLDVGEDFWAAGFGHFDRVHATYHSNVKLARPDVRHPRIVLAGCSALVEGDGDDAGLVPALRSRGLHARWLSWDDPATLEADLVIPRATWDYTERLDEFLAWTRRVPNLRQRPRRGGVEHRQAVPRRSRGGGRSDRAEHLLRAGGDRPVPGRGGGGQTRDRCGIGWRATVHRRRAGARSTRWRCRPTVTPRWCSPTIRGSPTARPRWCSSAASSPTPSTRGRCCRRPASWPPSTNPAPIAEETLRPADPDFELWDVGHAALAAAAARLGIDVDEFLYARVDVIGGPDDPRLLELELVEPSLGWRQLDETARATCSSASSRSASSQPSIGSGSGPCRTDRLSHRRP